MLNFLNVSAVPLKSGSRRLVCCDADAVAVGELLFDCVVGGSCLPGGAPANVCSALVKLGNSSCLFGAVGDDEDGHKLIESLDEAGVETSLIQKLAGHPTRRVLVGLKPDGDRVFEGFDGGVNTDFADVYIRPSEDLSQVSTVVVTGTLALAFETSNKAVRSSLKGARSQGLSTLVDVNWRPVFWEDSEADAKAEIFDYVNSCADIVKISDDEVEFLMGISPELGLSKPNEVLQAFGDGVTGVLVTAGPKGASFAFRSEGGIKTGFVGGFAVKAVDTTGAGDAFVAGFLSEALAKESYLPNVSRLKPTEIEKMLEFACAAGALTTTANGAMDAQPTRTQVEEFLKNQ
mmetsp:Transcript_24129/g.95044  ORF Transcript_24129/g.95044 Transcript_24129/m.95044 type:complete len:347 (-) Transcript_24129:1593-2633(-)